MRVIQLFALLLAGALFACPLLANEPSPLDDPRFERILAGQARFAAAERAALAEPFVGVTVAGDDAGALPPRRPAEFDRAPMNAAADAFLRALEPVQRIRTLRPLDDPEWRTWSNLDAGIYPHGGTALVEMNGAARAHLDTVLDAALSAEGRALVDGIRRTDSILAALHPDLDWLGEELYYATVFGLPAGGAPWGFQFEGHHLAVNWLDDGGRVSATPLFVGGEAVDVREGPFAGSRILQRQQDQALALLRSLSPAQRRSAVLATEKTANALRAGAGGDNVFFEAEGLPASEMTAAQREALVALIRSYVGTFRDEVAQTMMADVVDGLAATRFAWIGGDGSDAVFYYRIQSPALLVEFDHQNPVWTTASEPRGRPTRQHIHAVVRTPEGRDYGRDLLAEHLAAQPH